MLPKPVRPGLALTPGKEQDGGREKAKDLGSRGGAFNSRRKMEEGEERHLQRS